MRHSNIRLPVIEARLDNPQAAWRVLLASRWTVGWVVSSIVVSWGIAFAGLLECPAMVPEPPLVERCCLRVKVLVEVVLYLTLASA